MLHSHTQLTLMFSQLSYGHLLPQFQVLMESLPHTHTHTHTHTHPSSYLRLQGAYSSCKWLPLDPQIMLLNSIFLQPCSLPLHIKKSIFLCVCLLHKLSPPLAHRPCPCSIGLSPSPISLVNAQFELWLPLPSSPRFHGKLDTHTPKIASFL